MKPFKVIIFDLDDTLLDTWGTLIQPAILETCKTMVENGLKISEKKCISEWKESLLKNPRENPIDRLAKLYSSESNYKNIKEAGRNSFYNRKVNKEAHLLPFAKKVLSRLKEDFELYLVTYGHPKTQKEKVIHTKISSFFNHIFYVNNDNLNTKKDTFQNILLKHDYPTTHFLCIGNRLDSEIKDANQLGMTTCWYRYGEHATMEPINNFEKPDFEIKSLLELKTICEIKFN